jgi:hypothetical protein
LWWTKWRRGRFSPSTSVSPVIHSTKFSILTITRGRYNRPKVADVPSGPSLDSTPHYAKIMQSGSGCGPLESCYEHGNDPMGSIKCREILEESSDWGLLEKDSAPWSSLYSVSVRISDLSTIKANYLWVFDYGNYTSSRNMLTEFCSCRWVDFVSNNSQKKAQCRVCVCVCVRTRDGSSVYQPVQMFLRPYD